VKKLLSSVFIALIVSLSACSSPSATICGVQVREGEKTKIKTNQEVLTALKDMDEASNKSGSSSFVSISVDMNVLSVVSLFRTAGLGSDGNDGNSVILRNAKAYQEFSGGTVLLESSCEN
jgi:hypothetical protein